MKGILFIPLFCLVTISLSKANDTIKIMPVGNSITAGEHYGFPAIEDRTGYRKALYDMLIKADYKVDFVGSQQHGIRPEDDKDWYDWNCEAYPGWKIPDIAGKVNDAMKIYKPDILLVHVGTNGSDWDQKPGQVMEMLDSINQFSVENDHPITVFLCKIIKRFIDEDSAPTSQFNKDVADKIAARTGDEIEIIMVDMEDGAGLDYTDHQPDSTVIPPIEGGDMWGYTYPGMTKVDKYHPNDKGNYKMAVKFYTELVKVLPMPDSIENILAIPSSNASGRRTKGFLKIYPVPVNDILYFELDDGFDKGGVIHVFDNMGMLVVTKNLDGVTNSINVQNLKGGIYHVKISNYNGIVLKH